MSVILCTRLENLHEYAGGWSGDHSLNLFKSMRLDLGTLIIVLTGVKPLRQMRS